MILGVPRNSLLILALKLCTASVLLCTTASLAWATPSAKVLLLPFQVIAGEEEKELMSFSDHVDKRIRSAVTLLGEEYVIESAQTKEDLLKGRPLTAIDEAAEAAARQAGADLVVYGFLRKEDATFQMRGVMRDLRTGRVTVTTDLKVTNIHGLTDVLQVFVNTICRRLHGTPRLPFYKTEPAGATGPERTERPAALVALPRNTGHWRSPDIEGTLAGIDVGDLDGDGKNETVFLERSGVTISRYESGSLRPLTQFSQSPAAYISAEVEDLDGDGVAELLLCYQTPTGLESAIVSYRGRNFKVAATFPNMILRVVADPADDKSKVLVGQRMDDEDIWTGEMVRFRYENGTAEPVGKIMLPPGTFLLSYVAGHLGKAKDFLSVILNQDQRLMVFDRENRLLAQLSDKIYGTYHRIRIQSANKSLNVTYPGRLLIADTNGDGENELLVIKQTGGESEIQAMEWDGTQLVKKWNSVPSAGIISDFRIRDLKNEGIRSLVLILVKPGPLFAFSGPRSTIFAYDLIP
jgi:hypothetical protein